jgi:hypothetical protein
MTLSACSCQTFSVVPSSVALFFPRVLLVQAHGRCWQCALHVDVVSSHPAPSMHSYATTVALVDRYHHGIHENVPEVAHPVGSAVPRQKCEGGLLPCARPFVSACYSSCVPYFYFFIDLPTWQRLRRVPQRQESVREELLQMRQYAIHQFAVTFSSQLLCYWTGHITAPPPRIMHPREVLSLRS